MKTEIKATLIWLAIVSFGGLFFWGISREVITAKHMVMFFVAVMLLWLWSVIHYYVKMRKRRHGK